MCIYVWIIANMIRACMLMKILLMIVLNTEKIGIRYCSNNRFRTISKAFNQ